MLINQNYLARKKSFSPFAFSVKISPSFSSVGMKELKI